MHQAALKKTLFGQHGNRAGAMSGVISRDRHGFKIRANEPLRWRRLLDLANDSAGISRQTPSETAGRNMEEGSIAQDRQRRLSLPALDDLPHMFGDAGQNFSHGESRGVGHLDQLFELSPRFPRIDRFSSQPDSVLDRRGVGADVERS